MEENNPSSPGPCGSIGRSVLPQAARPAPHLPPRLLQPPLAQPPRPSSLRLQPQPFSPQPSSPPQAAPLLTSSRPRLPTPRRPTGFSLGLLLTNHKWAFIQAEPDPLISVPLSTPSFPSFAYARRGSRQRGGWARRTPSLPPIGWRRVGPGTPPPGLKLDWVEAVQGSAHAPPRIVNHTIP